MDDDGSLLLTIGQLAGRTGLAVRTIRYWSDIGAVPPAGRSSGGHRLYDAQSLARLELVATLRELGLGLDEVRRVLAREATVTDVAAAQVDAWVELAELAQDPGFRQRMRTMAEYHAGAGAAAGPDPGEGMPAGFSRKVFDLAGQARQRGVAPDSPEAARVVDQLLGGADAARRAYVRQRLAAGIGSRSDRYHELLAVINGQQPRPSRTPDLTWLLAAIDSHPA